MKNTFGMENCDQACVSVSLRYYDKHHKLGDLNSMHLFTHSSEGWESEVWVPAGTSFWWGFSSGFADSYCLSMPLHSMFLTLA